jgi:hypothetical protein
VGASNGNQPAASSSAADPSLADLLAYERAGEVVVDALDQLESSHQDLMERKLHPWMAKQAIQRMYACTWVAYLCQTVGNELLEQASLIRANIPADIVRDATACYQGAADWSAQANMLGTDPNSVFNAKLPASAPLSADASSPSPGYVLALVRAAEVIQERVEDASANLANFPQGDNFEPALKVIRIKLHETNTRCLRLVQMANNVTGVSGQMVSKLSAQAHGVINDYFALAQMLSIPALTGASLTPRYNPGANAIPAPVSPPPVVRPNSSLPQYNPSAPAPAEPVHRPPRYDPAAPPPKEEKHLPRYNPGSTATDQTTTSEHSLPRYDPTRGS